MLLRDDGLAILIELTTKDHEIALMADALQGFNLSQIEVNNDCSRVYFDQETLGKFIEEAGFRVAYQQVFF